MTVRTVLAGEGVSAPGSLSAPEFLGYTALDGDSAIAGHSVKPQKPRVENGRSTLTS
jgi:hypothetical protein